MLRYNKFQVCGWIDSKAIVVRLFMEKDFSLHNFPPIFKSRVSE